MKKTLLLAAIMMASFVWVNAQEQCNFSLYVESDIESDNLNEDLTFDVWEVLAGISVQYKTAAHRSDNENGIFYIGDEIHISVYGLYYAFAGWSDNWTGNDPDLAWSRDITLTENLQLGIMVRALDLQVKAYSSDVNLGSAIGSFAINNDSKETFKGTDMLSDKCTFAFFAEAKEGGKFLGWVSEVTYQQLKKDASETVFNEWISETIQAYNESQTSDEYTEEAKEVNRALLSPYIELDTEGLMIMNAFVQIYDSQTGTFALRAIFESDPTGVENVGQAAKTSSKVIRDGRVVITTADGKQFDTTGKAL